SNDEELHWLQQSVERQRPFYLTITSKDSKTNHHHRMRRMRKERTQVEVNWFRAYRCRQQTEFNLSRFVPFPERIISLPSKYHQKANWSLVAANATCQTFRSDDHHTLITYRPNNSFGQISNMSKLGNRQTTDNTHNRDRFCQLDWDKGKEVKWIYA